MDAIINLVTGSGNLLVAGVLTVIQLAGLATAWHAVHHVRTAQAAVAWVIGLLTMPILVMPLYWVFGRSRFAGYREAMQEVERQHRASVATVQQELMTEVNARDPGEGSPIEFLSDVLDTPLSRGNEFKLLIDDEFFDALLSQIRAAKSYVYAEFYILRDDEIGDRFADALIEQARAGRTVRLLYDEIGCVFLPKSYLKRLRDAVVDVRSFDTRGRWTNPFQLNFRNHRKMLIIDGRLAITGGFNVGDEYLGRASWVSHWRDTAIQVAGPGARKLQAVFAADYYWATRNDIPEAHWSRDEGSAVELCDS